MNYDSEEYDLHVATSLNQVNEVRNLLEKDFMYVHVQDHNGDQPAHIAARLGYIDVMMVLIEYDAPMGKRNYESLTPIGVARMGQRHEIVNILKIHYDYDQNDKEGNVNTTERCLIRRVGCGLIPSQAIIRELTEIERKKAMLIESLAKWNRDREENSSVLIQRYIRRYKARKELNYRKLCEKSATNIQVTWKWRHRDFQFRKRQRAARIIQSVIRMHQTKSYYLNFNKERLLCYRATRSLALLGQRLWRGFVGRSLSRRAFESKYLPNPDDISNFDIWLKYQTEANPPKRSWKIYAEYTLSGTPINWEERRIKRHGKYFRDVKFWVNILTRRSSWKQPEEWILQDRNEFEDRQQVLKLGFTLKADNCAKKLQSIWRAKIARRNLRFILHARHIMITTEETYLSNPNNIVALCNHTLYIHVMMQQYDEARLLYHVCLQKMIERGVDNAFILYGYSIFLASTREEDVDVIQDYLLRAKKAEDGYFLRKNKTKSEWSSIYKLADVGFYRQAALLQQRSDCWHNYALCRIFVFNDYDGGKKLFLRALRSAQQNEMKNIVDNYNLYMKDSCDSDAFNTWIVSSI